MFDEHQTKIGRYARQGPDEMARVYTFVLATIQQSLWMTPDIMQSIDREGIESRYLWGFKYDAYEYLVDNQRQIYDNAMDIYSGYASPEVQEQELLYYFASLPGLGIVKAGFMVQLCFGMAGCIDTHNLSMYGICPNKFKASRFKAAKDKTKRLIMLQYLTVIDSEGGCGSFWDRWCEYVAKRSPERYTGPYAVSELHVTAIGV